jgi:hypothetical protein
MTSELVRYRFDQWDEDAVSAGLEGSDAEADRWFEYSLDGESRVTLRCAVDVNASEHVLVDVELDGTSEQFATQVALLIDVFSSYRVCDDFRGSH